RRRAAACQPLRPQPPDEPELAHLLERLSFAPLLDTPGSGSTDEPPGAALAGLGPPEHEGDLGTLGRYRVLRELGRGGMGVVLLAYDPQLQRAVALKLLRPDRADAAARAQFVREAQAAAGLKHDHVVTVYAVEGPPEGPTYLAMEYVVGPTL